MMFARPLALLAAAAVLAGACAGDDEVVLQFDRGTSDPTMHPFPTDEYVGADALLSDFSEDQLAQLPYLRQLRLSGQTGFSPTSAIRLPFTPARDEPGRWIDVDTLADGIRVYRLGGTPLVVTLGQLTHDPRSNTVRVRPREPWPIGSYAVVVETGRIKTRNGANIGVSFDYSRIRKSGDSDTDATFAEVSAVDPTVSSRADTLAFFTFTVADHDTQLSLLQSYVSGKVAVQRDDNATLLDVTPWAPLVDREIAMRYGATVASGPAVAGLYQQLGLGDLDSTSIGRVVTGEIATPNFVSDTVIDIQALFTNGTFRGRLLDVPFGPDNPIRLSQRVPSRAIPYLLILPATAGATPPPIVVAMHGVSRQKEDFYALAPALTAAGFAVIAVDLYQHGARQKDIEVAEGDFRGKVDAALIELGESFPDPFVNTTFLARTRDKLRQSIVDQLALIRLLTEGDGGNAHVDFDGDGVPDDWGPKHLVGHSLGAMLATGVAAVSPDLDGVVLSVPGGPLNQVIVDSPALSDELEFIIYLTSNTPGFGLLGSADRYMTPGSGERELYSRVADVIIANGDPLTFGPALLDGRLGNGAPRVLVQLAMDDLVVPPDASTRFVWAVAAGATQADDFAQLRPVLRDFGLPEADATSTRSGVSAYEGGHSLLIDFADPAVTAAAQTQLVTFLAGGD